MKLEKNHCYLVKESGRYKSTVYLIRVEDVTQKCYHIKYERADHANWYEGYVFDLDNDIVEDLGIDYKWVRDTKIDEIVEK